MTAVVTAPGLLYAASPGAWQLTYNGLLIGAGADVQLLELSGLRELPPTRSGDVAKPRQHGAFGGRTLFDERIVTAKLGVSAPTNDFETVLAAVSSAFPNITDPANLLPLQFQVPGWSTPRQVWCRPTQGGYPIDLGYQFRKVTIPVQLTAPDPLIYDTAVQTASTGLPSPTAGLGFPASAPFTFGASSGGSVQLVNAGNEAAPIVFTINGPVTWPQLTLGSLFLGFQVSLGAGDKLVVDTGAGTAVLKGTASRAGTIVTGSTYFYLPPATAAGPTTSTIGFSSVDATQVTGTLTATASSAWGWC
jgi:hypothetical protein